MAGELADTNGFLWNERLSERRRLLVLSQLQRGQVIIERLETHENGKIIPIPNGLVHHWIALVFIPGVHLSQTLAQQQTSTGRIFSAPNF